MSLKIFTSHDYLPANSGVIPMLYPHWKINNEEAVFSDYISIGRSINELVLSIQDAGAVILPADWRRGYVFNKQEDLAYSLAEIAAQADLPFVIFFHGDEEWTVPVDGAYIFRHSIYHSLKSATTYAMPAWNQDILRQHLGNELVIRTKQLKPVLGFCGKARWAVDQFLKMEAKRLIKLAKRQQKNDSYLKHPITLRSQILRKLESDKNISTNFITHKKYYGGSYKPKTQTFDRYQKTVVTDLYVQNMINSDYTICVRGAGNYSYRIYESLSAGRIPIFINTDCVLPYDFMLKYRDYFVWIEEDEIDLISEKVVNFHESLSENDFIDMQYQCRKLYDLYLSPQGFFRNFYHHFNQIY